MTTCQASGPRAVPPALVSVAAPSAVLPGVATVAPERAAEQLPEVMIVVVGAGAAATVGGEAAKYSMKPSLQHLQYH